MMDNDHRHIDLVTSILLNTIRDSLHIMDVTSQRIVDGVAGDLAAVVAVDLCILKARRAAETS